MKKLLFAFALASIATTTQAISLDECQNVVTSYDVMADASGSMMLNFDNQDKSKFELAKDFMLKLSDHKSLVDVKANLLTVAPFTNYFINGKNEGTFKEAVESLYNMEVVGRPTYLGKRGSDYLNNSKDKTLIFITDGDIKPSEEQGYSFKNEFASFVNHGNRLYVVSLAKSSEEKDALAKIFSDKVSVYDLNSLLSDDKQYVEFVKEVFPQDCMVAPVIEIADVLFDFDKDTLTDEAQDVLLHAYEVINARFEKAQKNNEIFSLEVKGYTDYMGSDAYNLDLSLRRAQRVKDFLVSKGFDKDLIKARGMGKSFKYPNDNAIGRHQNRRVELVFDK